MEQWDMFELLHSYHVEKVEGGFGVIVENSLNERGLQRVFDTLEEAEAYAKKMNDELS